MITASRRRCVIAACSRRNWQTTLPLQATATPLTRAQAFSRRSVLVLASDRYPVRVLL